MRRRSLLAALVAPCIVPGTARAKRSSMPENIRIFVGFAAGGGADTIARSIAAQLERRLGRRVSVENRSGSAASLPGEIVKKGPADGSQLAFLSSTTLVSRLATRDFPYDPVRDLMPVTLVGRFPLAFALSPTLGIDTFDGYLRWTRSGDSARRRLGNTSSNAFVDILNLLLDRSTGEVLVRTDYRGAAPLVADLEQGRLPACVTTVTSLLPAHRGGRVRIVMITGAHRLAVAPDLPTAAELGYPRLDMTEWFAFFAPPSTPEALVTEWNRQLRAALADPAVTGVVEQLGLAVETSTSADLETLVDSHHRDWSTRIATIGMTPVN